MNKNKQIIDHNQGKEVAIDRLLYTIRQQIHMNACPNPVSPAVYLLREFKNFLIARVRITVQIFSKYM